MFEHHSIHRKKPAEEKYLAFFSRKKRERKALNGGAGLSEISNRKICKQFREGRVLCFFMAFSIMYGLAAGSANTCLQIKALKVSHRECLALP